MRGGGVSSRVVARSMGARLRYNRIGNLSICIEERLYERRLQGLEDPIATRLVVLAPQVRFTQDVPGEVHDRCPRGVAAAIGMELVDARAMGLPDVSRRGGSLDAQDCIVVDLRVVLGRHGL